MSEELVVDGVTVLVIEDTDLELLETAEQGPQGPPGTTSVIEFPFAWGDASPRTVTTVPAGKLVYGAQIHISIAFNGTAPALTVGDAGQANRLMTTSQNDPAAIGTYTTSPAHRYGSNTAVLLTITPGDGATSGTGLLTLFVEN